MRGRRYRIRGFVRWVGPWELRAIPTDRLPKRWVRLCQMRGQSEPITIIGPAAWPDGVLVVAA